MATARKVTHQATVTRALIGLAAAGTLPGGMLTVALFVAARQGIVNAALLQGKHWWMWPLVVALYSVMFMLLGALAAPVWWLLDRRGVRQWWAAALVGATPLALATVVLTVLDVRRGLTAAATVSLLGKEAIGVLVVSAIGAAMGLIAWRVAYRRVPDAVEAF